MNSLHATGTFPEAAIRTQAKLDSCRIEQTFVYNKTHWLTLRRRIKSHLLFAGIIRSSPFSPR